MLDLSHAPCSRFTSCSQGEQTSRKLEEIDQQRSRRWRPAAVTEEILEWCWDSDEVGSLCRAVAYCFFSSVTFLQCCANFAPCGHSFYFRLLASLEGLKIRIFFLFYLFYQFWEMFLGGSNNVTQSNIARTRVNIQKVLQSHELSYKQKRHMFFFL